MSDLPPPPLSEPRPVLEAVVAPHRLAMGLSAIPVGAPWLEVDSDLRADLEEKRRLLAERRAEVLIEQPASRPAQREALAHVVEALLRDHPHQFSRAGRSLCIPALDEPVDLEDESLAPLERAARCVQEDLCVMERKPEGWCLTAGVVCFPTRWRLAPMLGKPMTAIHARVPGYREQLATSAHRFFDGMKSGTVFRRANWSLMDDPALFQPTGKMRSETEEGIDASNAGERVWLRVETQTLQRLPTTGAILFGIRIHRTRLVEVGSDPRAAQALLDAMQTMAPAMQVYKSLGRVREAATAYLGAHVDERARIGPSLAIAVPPAPRAARAESRRRGPPPRP